jgi:hypothetical protein
MRKEGRKVGRRHRVEWVTEKGTTNFLGLRILGLDFEGLAGVEVGESDPGVLGEATLPTRRGRGRLRRRRTKEQGGREEGKTVSRTEAR